MRIVNEAKITIYAMYLRDSDYVMTFNTAIHSISNTLKKFFLQSYLNSYYIQTKYNGK